MAFFDNVKTKAKKAFDFTSKKTVEISDKVNIKLSIKSNEAKTDDHYKTLGKLYYDSRANSVNFDSDIENEIAALNSLKEAKNKLEIQLAKADGKKFCPECSSAIDANAQFCPICGGKCETPAEEPIVTPAEVEETPADTNPTADEN